MAELLFHGVSTGAGVQTLGEEYCDILQVAGEPAATAGNPLIRLVCSTADQPGCCLRVQQGQRHGHQPLSMVPACPDQSLLNRAALLARVLKRRVGMKGSWVEAGLWLGHLALTGACPAAAGRMGTAPSAGRRGLLVLLECVAPYLAERVSQSADAELVPGVGRAPTWAAPAHSMGGALDDLDMEAPASLSGSCSEACLLSLTYS